MKFNLRTSRRSIQSAQRSVLKTPSSPTHTAPRCSRRSGSNSFYSLSNHRLKRFLVLQRHILFNAFALFPCQSVDCHGSLESLSTSSEKKVIEIFSSKKQSGRVIYHRSDNQTIMLAAVRLTDAPHCVTASRRIADPNAVPNDPRQPSPGEPQPPRR